MTGTGVDPYTGFDQFNRIIDNRWYSTADGTDLDRIQHGYDRAGNRLWRKNTVADAAGVYLDEFYVYDGLYRLARLDRGQLDSANTGIISGMEDFIQAWALDATGNWLTFDQAETGGSWTIEQARTANAVNEITGITGDGWIVPAYDAAGNTTQFPQASTPSTANQAVYDAWNRMISVSPGASPIQQNTYGGENRRVTKLVAGTLRRSYLSFEWRSLEERLGASSSPDRQYVWGRRYIDDLVMRDRGIERIYACQDANWNVTAICGSGAHVAERYAYAAYGMPVFLSSTFTVTGISAHDWETGSHKTMTSRAYRTRRHRRMLVAT